MYIHFNSWQQRHKKPFGAVKVGTKVRFMLAVTEGKLVTAELHVYADGETTPMITELEERAFGQYYAYFTPPKSGLYFYHFKLVMRQGEQEVVSYYGTTTGGQGELFTEPELLAQNSYQLTCYDHAVAAPKWYREGIAYQIFPDRFYNGDPEQKIQGKKENTFIYATTKDLPMYIRNQDGSIARWDFYGGNFQGIKQKIPYLKELGVSVIYLNPIFEAASNHRYDTGDYFKVDPMLGTKQDFKELLEALHQAKIAVILDGVFSHVGRNSKYFNFNGAYGADVGAARDKNSKYYPWFDFSHYPERYRSWWGNADLPVVDKNDPTYQQFIYGQKDSVLAKWNDFGVDGWRLDVADELPDEFIKNIHKNLSNYSEKILLGEVWEDASNKVAYDQRRHYVAGDELDGVMNYPVRKAILDLLLNRCPVEKVALEMMKLRENYPLDFYLNALNNIGTHDTKRILTEVSGDKEKVKRAFDLLMMFPGVPCIYYGDEAGLAGAKDPDNRRFYPWGREDHELIAYVKAAVAKRRQQNVLAEGDLTLLAGKNFFAIVRYQGEKKVFYLLNASAKENVFSIDQLEAFHDETNARADLTVINGKKFDPWEGYSLTITAK